MEVISKAQLEAMGLEEKRTDIDEVPTLSSWPRKAILHAAVKAQNTVDKPRVDKIFRYARGNTVSTAVRCNMGIHIIKIQASVTTGNEDIVELPDEFYLCKEETGVWTMKYLTSAKGTHKHNAHLKHASDVQTYSIPDYNEYVPTEVLNAAEKYKALYQIKYGGDNPTLTKEMMTFTFISFKCDVAMEEDGFIAEHVKEVHNVPGIPNMTPAQVIEVDAKQEFNLPDLLDIEIAGPDKHNTKVNTIYSRCVSRNVLQASNNKCNADLVASKSQDFMTELGKRTNINFFNRFKMHLAQELNVDIEADFTCKWSSIEKSLFKAMSKEQDTIRLANFYDTNYTDFHSMPMELLINKVDQYVDTALGKSTSVHKDSKNRTLCNYLYSIRMKYWLIFEIARHLNNDFRIIKEYIMQLCTKMHDSIIEVMDIADFQKNLASVFETKGVLTQFKNENIPATKKNMSVNETKVKNDKKYDKYKTVEDTKELLDQLKKDFDKAKIGFKEDKALKQEVDTMALKLAEDPANDNLIVVQHEQIANLLKSKKQRVC